ncbi:MAG: thioesterase family protein [Deltaproteobacteria bacterium]|nr:thioesterase family protein [Deltaproteobacteria bacterium]
MPKVKLQKIESYRFKTSEKIRVSDLNYGGHLGYDKILALIHNSRLELFKNWGVTELDLGDGKTGIVATDSIVNYLGEGFLHDTLTIEIEPVEAGSLSFRLAHNITRTSDGSPVALAEVGFIGFDYKTRSPSRLPKMFCDFLKNSES